MSHTNTTANYNLPQFVGTDKPSWLTDVNGAMTSIDTQMKANADANTTTAGDLTTLAGRVTTAEQNITTQGGTLQTVSNVATSASTTATNAKNGVTEIASFLNISQFNALTASVTNASFDWQQYSEAVNEDGTFGKIYGSARLKRTGTGSVVMSIPTSFRPESAITINGICWTQVSTEQTTGYDALIPASFTIATNGTLTATIDVAINSYARVYFMASVIFAKDFGDIVNPNA